MNHTTGSELSFYMGILKWLILNNNTWKHLTVCKQMTSTNLFKNKVTYKQFASKSYIYIYIYMLPHGGLSSLVKELSATVSVMQGSSKELSSLVAMKKCKQRLLLLFAKYKIPKIPLANVVRLWPCGLKP